jgi:hypothetical protein
MLLTVIVQAATQRCHRGMPLCLCVPLQRQRHMQKLPVMMPLLLLVTATQAEATTGEPAMFTLCG